jgi:hypothetical protein
MRPISHILVACIFSALKVITNTKISGINVKSLEFTAVSFALFGSL